MVVKITKVNKSDLSRAAGLVNGLKGKLFGNKGYISRDLFNNLYSSDLRIITGIRKDMKNHLLEIEDKILLRKRSRVENVFYVLKNRMNLEHTRHRSPINFLVHIIACVVSYAVNKLFDLQRFSPPHSHSSS